MANLLVDLARGTINGALVRLSASTLSAQLVGSSLDMNNGTVYTAAVLALVNTAGTNPTLAVKIQESDDNVTFTDVVGGAFTTSTLATTSATNVYQVIQFQRTKRYIQAYTTIGGTSSPSYTYFVCAFDQFKVSGVGPSGGAAAGYDRSPST